MTKPFHLGDVLSITTGKLVSPRLMQGVYEILSFMTGDSIFTHQIGRAMKACVPALIKQHPQLATIVAPELDEWTCRTWLAEQVEEFGETLEVAPLDTNEWTHIDPIIEAESMFPDKV